jgi:hypothetical protein
MMESLMKLPDDMFNQEILQHLTLNNKVKLDDCQYKDIPVWSVTVGRPEDPPPQKIS